MIDASFHLAPARAVIAIDLWEGDLPPLPGRAIRVEPRRWWLLDGGDSPAIGDRGAAAPIGGGLIRATLTGPDWRALLSVSGFLDTEMLRAGDVAATVIHHVPVRIVVTADDACEVYFAASYADTLDDLWRHAITGG